MPLADSSIQLFSSIRTWIEPTLKAIGARLEEFDARLTAIPAGLQGPIGPSGKDGSPGEPGPAGKDLDPLIVTQLIETRVALAVSAIPPAPAGKDGAPGINGSNGKDGADGSNGTNGVDGKDGGDGKDGQDADPVLIESLVERQFAAMAEDFMEGLRP